MSGFRDSVQTQGDGFLSLFVSASILRKWNFS